MVNLEYWSDVIAKFSPLKVDSKLCSKVISHKSSCKKCIEVCPTGGIEIENGQVYIGQCTECGICASVCPNDVFRFNDEYYFDNPKELGGKYVFSCKPMIHNNKKILGKCENINQINCFGQIYPELLINLFSKNKEVIFLYDSEKCKDCFNFDITPLLTRVEDFATAMPFIDDTPFKILNDASALNADIIATPKVNEEVQVNAGRRDFFNRVKVDSKKLQNKVVLDTLEKIENKPAEKIDIKVKYAKPLGVSVKRYYLAKALTNAEINNDEPLPYTRPSFSDKCILCKVCSMFCPTKALSVREIEDEQQLIYQPIKCNNCRLCENICIFGGINWQKDVLVSDITQKTSYIISKNIGEVKFPKQENNLKNSLANSRGRKEKK